MEKSLHLSPQTVHNLVPRTIFTGDFPFPFLSTTLRMNFFSIIVSILTAFNERDLYYFSFRYPYCWPGHSS